MAQGAGILFWTVMASLLMLAALILSGAPSGAYARSYVATATTSGLQGTVDMTIITQSFQEDTGYGRTACRRYPEGQAG